MHRPAHQLTLCAMVCALLASGAAEAAAPAAQEAKAVVAGPVLIVRRLEGKRGPAGRTIAPHTRPTPAGPTPALNANMPHAVPLAIAFDGPMGDGRRGAKGVVVRSGPEWFQRGTRWTFRYARSQSAYGLQLIHPFKDGQVIVHITKSGVGMSSPRAWTEVGYHGGDRRALKQTEDHRDIFPMKDGEEYRFASTLAADGSYQLSVNDKVVVTATVTKAQAISFEIEPGTRFPGASGWAKLKFKGEGFPMAWKLGYAGVLVEPLDNGKNIVSDLRFSPSIIKLHTGTDADF